MGGGRYDWEHVGLWDMVCADARGFWPLRRDG